MSATEILHFIIRQGDAGNLAEEMMVLDEMGSPIPARVEKAQELGFWAIDIEGNISLTSKGAAYLAA